MPYILSVGTHNPPHYLPQHEVKKFVRELFNERYKGIDRLMRVFHNGQIEGRYFSAPLKWFQEDHSFSEKNNRYQQLAVQFGIEAIRQTLGQPDTLRNAVPCEAIDAIFFISSSGIATPSIEVTIMNRLPFSAQTKRIPIWGLGCAGGAAGIARAAEYCTAFPTANVLVLSVELCSLTFQRNDVSKSNLVGASLFADGVACTLVCGDQSPLLHESLVSPLPYVVEHQSILMPDSEDVMGWDVKDSGLHVLFSKDIPSIVEKWLRPSVEQFLYNRSLTIEKINHFICHPGGRKVLEAYSDSLQIAHHKLQMAYDVLKNYGNMSSATVLYVLKRYMKSTASEGDKGLLLALGPGFSAEIVLLKWTDKQQRKKSHVVS